MVVNILLSSNGQLSLYELNSLSFNNLGLQVKGSTNLQALLDTLNIAMSWSLALMVAAAVAVPVLNKQCGGNMAWGGTAWGVRSYV